MLYRVVHEEAQLHGVPDAVAPLVRACLAKDPEERPSTLQLSLRLKEIAAREAQGLADVRPPAPRSGRRTCPRDGSPTPTRSVLSGGRRAGRAHRGTPAPRSTPGARGRPRHAVAIRRAVPTRHAAAHPPAAARRPATDPPPGAAAPRAAAEQGRGPGRGPLPPPATPPAGTPPQRQRRTVRAAQRSRAYGTEDHGNPLATAREPAAAAAAAVRVRGRDAAGRAGHRRRAGLPGAGAGVSATTGTAYGRSRSGWTCGATPPDIGHPDCRRAGQTVDVDGRGRTVDDRLRSPAGWPGSRRTGRVAGRSAGSTPRAGPSPPRRRRPLPPRPR